MESTHQLSLGKLLGMLGSWIWRQTSDGTREGTTSLERMVESSESTNRFHFAGQVESLEDINRYNLDILIERRGAEKGPYFINGADLIRFIDTIYPTYVRGANGNYIQVNLHSDKPSDQKPIIFSTYSELTKYVESADLARIINEPNVSIKYNGSNTDVPQTISIKRKPLLYPTTNYSVVVEASKEYNFNMIDASLGFLFSGRAKLFPPDKYK